MGLSWGMMLYAYMSKGKVRKDNPKQVIVFLLFAHMF